MLIRAVVAGVAIATTAVTGAGAAAKIEIEAAGSGVSFITAGDRSRTACYSAADAIEKVRGLCLATHAHTPTRPLGAGFG